MRVPVVDDHEDQLQAYVEELRTEGFDVEGTTDPNGALNVAIAWHPDLVVMDIAMPGLDGYELGRLLRSYFATRGIRIVAVSAYELDRSKLPPGGCEAYLRKPF